MLKILLWMNMPSHHQSGFIAALAKHGIDLQVTYYGNVTTTRKNLGWSEVGLKKNEYQAENLEDAISNCKDWTERIHIVPGFGCKFLRKLIRKLINKNVKWLHWSEPAHPGWKWYLSYPLKLYYAHTINKYALGALAIGGMAKADFIRWGIKPNKIRNLPYSLDALEATNQEPNIKSYTKDYKCCFLFVGQLSERKQVGLLIKAFSKIFVYNKEACLVIVGTGSDNFYKELAARTKSVRDIFFAGPCPSQDISSVISICDVLVLPSSFDGWGMVLSEAASLGKALIASDRCGAASYLILNDENGFVFENKNINDLTKSMMHYVKHPTLAEQHGNVSKRLFDRISTGKCVGKLIESIDYFKKNENRN